MQELLLAVARGLVEDKDAVKVTVDAPREDGTIVYHLSVAEGDSLVAQGGKRAGQQRGRPRKMRARAQRGRRQRAEHGVLGKVRAFAQHMVGHPRQEPLHHGQQRAALGAALRDGHARVAPDDQQPHGSTDRQDAAGAAVHFSSASFCVRILSTQHLWHMAT